MLDAMSLRFLLCFVLTVQGKPAHDDNEVCTCSQIYLTFFLFRDDHKRKQCTIFTEFLREVGMHVVSSLKSDLKLVV